MVSIQFKINEREFKILNFLKTEYRYKSYKELFLYALKELSKKIVNQDLKNLIEKE